MQVVYLQPKTKISQNINKMDLSPAYKKLKQYLKENENKLKGINSL